MVEDIDDLVIEQPRIDRVQDGAHSADAVEALEVAKAVHRKRRDPIPTANAEVQQRCCEAPRPVFNLGVVGPMQCSIRSSGDYLTFAVILSRMADDG